MCVGELTVSKAFKTTCWIAVVAFTAGCEAGANGNAVLASKPDPVLASKTDALLAAPPGAKYWPMPASTDQGGRVNVTWDGTVAELLAADALASCWSGIPEEVRKPTDNSYGSSFIRGNGFGDPVISELLTKMDAAVCEEHRIRSSTWFTRPAYEIFDGWIAARKDPACSVNATTGGEWTLDLSEERQSLSSTASNLPTAIPLASRREAQAELAYGDLYLCMTQRLVEHTQSSFVFDASAEDVLRLYDLARNRALLSVFQYSLLAKVFAMPQSTMSGLSQTGYGTVAALKAWANGQSEIQQAGAGADLALSVDLLSSLTEKQVSLLRRDASRQAKARGVEAQSNILQTLYGDAAPDVSRVTQDLSAPEVGILLGLARSADALDLFLTAGGARARVLVDRTRAADSLLRAAEGQLRLQRCPEGDAACSTVSASQSPDEYELFTQFGIDRRHALTLVDALTEALLGPPPSDSEEGYPQAVANAPAGVGKLVKLVGAWGETCGLFDTGVVGCWGNGGLEVPADGGLDCSGVGCTSPSRWVRKAGATLLTDVTDLSSAAGNVACALTKAGEVYCWGIWQMRGGGSAISAVKEATPVLGLPAAAADPVRHLAAGAVSGCVVTTSGRLFCWGYGSTGVLGDGTRGGSCTVNAECGPRGGCVNNTCQQSIAYTAVESPLQGVRQVAIGSDHACALLSTGGLRCWGTDRYGVIGAVPASGVQCGQGPCFTLPTAIPISSAMGTLVSVAVNSVSTCVLNSAGQTFCWGLTNFVGRPTSSDGSCGATACVRTPQRVQVGTQPLQDVVALSGGGNHMCAEARGGAVYCWGTNADGQLGTGTTTYASSAVAVTAGPVTGVAAGNSHTCALAWPSGAACWGRNTNGQLGNGTTTGSTTAVNAVLPSDAPSYPIENLTPLARVGRVLASARPSFHLLGAALVQDGSGARVHLDSNFQLVTLDSHELQAGATLRHIPARELDARAPAHGQGFLYRRFVVSAPASDGWGANAFEWGSVPTLALARESILQAAPSAGQFYAGAASALGLIDQSIGVRTSVLRKKVEVRDAVSRVCSGEGVVLIPDLPPPNLPADQINGVCREVVPVQGGARTAYELSMVTSEEDNVETVAFGARVSQALKKALRPDEAVLGSSNSDLMATATAPLSTRVAADGRELRTASLVLQSPASVFLEMPASPRENGAFQVLFDGSLRELGPSTDFLVLDGAISTRGGALNALAVESVEVHPTNWSMPRYDAYGLPIDWVPSADPSLLGSNGEEPYQYFLRLAEKTAREATKAIEDAAETTRQEETDAQTLAAAQQKGAQLREQESTLLCGKAPCEPVEWTTAPPVADIDPGCGSLKLPVLMVGADGILTLNLAITLCESRVAALAGMLSESIRLPTLVWNQRDRQVPAFDGLEGTELGKELLASWTGLRRLRDAYQTALAGIRTASANVTAARAEHTAALDEISVQKLNATLQNLTLAQQKQALITQATGLRSRLELVTATLDRVCSENGFNAAVSAGYSFSHAHSSSRKYYEQETVVEECTEWNLAGPRPLCEERKAVTHPPGSWSFSTKYDEGARSWSKGPLLAWDERCADLEEQLVAAQAEANGETLSELDRIAKEIGELGDGSGADLAAGVKAATSRALAAQKRTGAAEAAAHLSHITALGTVQEARAALLANVHEIELSRRKLELATERYKLDQALAEAEVGVRQRLRRRYQGFAHWRAEAMAESARRTAVAARRAIESRFVVDLSKLGSEEPFVAPPAVWADDVYDRDLKPPAAVGVTLSKGGGAEQQYNNKLLDYVGNLELFVSGYSVERPTSAARSDAEVMTLVAPTRVDAFDAAGDSYPLVDSGSLGWKFWCEQTGEYVANPAGMLFGDLDESLLQTMCDGLPPTRAVLTFWMDPWGRVGGNAFSAPFESRHNARWQRFALNLVGTGVRECEYARDPEQCYAEPFLRYSVRHVGPAWVTAHDLGWHALEIPSAVVEDGKALAIEEWLDPVSRGWNVGEVQAVARTEFAGRPLGGLYELDLKLTPDVRLSRIERIQLLTSVDYWVRQN